MKIFERYMRTILLFNMRYYWAEYLLFGDISYRTLGLFVFDKIITDIKRIKLRQSLEHNFISCFSEIEIRENMLAY